MEQIGDAERSLGWKEKCDDIYFVRDADVLLAVDCGAPQARLHRDFHPESFVWLDRNRMGGRAGLGLRERRAAAGVCDGWASTVLRPVRSDDRGRSFLPKLCPAAVSRTTRPVGGPTRKSKHCKPRDSHDFLQAPSVVNVMRAWGDHRKKSRQDALRVRSRQAGARRVSVMQAAAGVC